LGGIGLIFDFRGCWFVDQKASPGGGWVNFNRVSSERPLYDGLLCQPCD
jgi:hypothetical protein